MKRFLPWVFIVAATVTSGSATADDPNAVIEKAVKAMGGRQKLENIHAIEVRTKAVLNLAGAETPITAHAITQGLDHYRLEFEGNFGGNNIKALTIVAGNKGWRKFGDQVTELDERSLHGEQRMVYLQQVAGNPTLLTGKGFKMIKADQNAVTATGPDGNEFTIHYDKETGLPAKLVAKVIGFAGEEVKQETTFSDFKNFGGIKKATKAESKRDGDPFLKQEVVEFKVLDKVDPKTFEEPK